MELLCRTSSIDYWHLRHSCATLLQAQDVSPRVAMEISGHSHIAVTMNMYTKVVTALKRDAATRIDELINDR